jgi:lipoprotein-releasing system permease protein
VKLPFEVKVALRYIRSRRKAAVSLITIITIGGVAMGVCALTVVTSVWNGFEAEFLDKLLGINAHAVILKNHDVFRNHREAAQAIRKEAGITEVAPFVYSEVIAQSPSGVQGVAIKGIDPVVAARTPLSKYVAHDAFSLLRSATSTESDERPRPGIIIGNDLAETLHTQKGKSITIISPYGGREGEPRTESFEVVGIFHSGMYEFDARMVFIDLTKSQQFFRLYETVTGLEVWTEDPLKSYDVVNEGTRKIDPSDPLAYEVRDWSRTNRGLFGAVRSQKALITIVLGFIVLVAAFNIMATLILLILEKGREIAVLKSLGANNESILWIFVLDGQIVGVIGCVLGIVLGLTICSVLEAYGLKLDPRVYYLEHLPVVVRPLEVSAVAIGAMTAATLATLFPALKAAKLPPVAGLTQRQTFKAKEPPPAR